MDLSKVLTALALTLCACSQRRCGDAPQSTLIDRDSATVAQARTVDRVRCDAEIARGAVATVPGLGALDALVPACGDDDDTIAVFALRGHTLSRLVRARSPGSTFHLADPIATGADRLGPVGSGDTASLGPLAWRSPTVLLDMDVGDEWWVAWLEPGLDAGARVRRGSAVMPAGAEALGIIAPIARRDTSVEVLATLARAGSNPRLVRATVPTGGNELVPFTHDPPAIAEGELKAWERATGTALVFAIEPDGHMLLRAIHVPEDPASSASVLGTVRLARSHVLVAPAGIPLPGGDALFAYSEFDVVQRGAGPCVVLDESLCVAPGPVRMLRVGASGAVPTDLAPSGLIDTFAREHDTTMLALYVEGAGETRTQRAVRFDAASGNVRAARLTPSDALPPLDRPALVRCGDEVWLAAEVVVEPGDAGRARETAVMVLPAACVVEGDTGR
ncbi:MAG: hypothetical protein WCJ30_05285 [Deltaproteobacteria bacterium]